MLRKLPVETRLTISLFLAFCLAGPFVNALYHILKVGVGLDSGTVHYQGNGDLPPKSFLEMVETTHFHTWIQAVVMFLASLLFSLTGQLGPRRRGGLVVAGYGFVLLHLISPFLARLAVPGGTLLVLASAVGITFCLWLYAGFVLREIWSAPGRYN
ncbi:MAG: hypothetical protein HYY13_11345 [Nitrospirae bacterium]|nr:hypothetical protein [Nitrospirota bacterium]